jgi:hypothetical protein
VMKITLSEATTGCAARRANHAWGWSSAPGKNIPLRRYPKSPLKLPPSRTRQRGVSRSSRTLGAGCDGRGSVGRATCSQGGLRPVSDRAVRRRTALKRLRRNFGRQHMSRSKRLVEEAADGKGVWFWHPWLVSSWRRFTGPNRASGNRQFVSDGGKRNSSPGRARYKP